MPLRAMLLAIGLTAAAAATNVAAADPPADPPAAPLAEPAQSAPEEEQVDAKTLHDFTVTTMEGDDVSLAQYKGKVVLVVNVASKCGLTPQYEALQRLYEEKKDKGLVVLAFPANNFGNQEPGTNEQIMAFCRDRYAVTFPVFAKISVKGDDQHALYQWLTSLPQPKVNDDQRRPGAAAPSEQESASPQTDDQPAVGGDIPWNFTKFLFGPDGKPVARFEPRTTPDDPALVARVDELLALLPKEQEASATVDTP